VLLLPACVSPPPAQAPAPPQAVRVDFAVVGPAAEPAPAPLEPAPAEVEIVEGPLVLDQPPEIKLKLGHYASGRFGIGLVIDRTEQHTAKVRFDGASKTERLFARYTWHHVDYHRAKYDKVLEVQPDGRIAVFVSGQEIWVRRDGDARPL
jgi:hypothetical protein